MQRNQFLDKITSENSSFVNQEIIDALKNDHSPAFQIKKNV